MPCTSVQIQLKFWMMFMKTDYPTLHLHLEYYKPLSTISLHLVLSHIPKGQSHGFTQYRSLLSSEIHSNYKSFTGSKIKVWTPAVLTFSLWTFELGVYLFLKGVTNVCPKNSSLLKYQRSGVSLPYLGWSWPIFTL